MQYTATKQYKEDVTMQNIKIDIGQAIKEGFITCPMSIFIFCMVTSSLYCLVAVYCMTNLIWPYEFSLLNTLSTSNGDSS